MRIHADFTGGNIRVLRICDTDVYVRNEIRDTMEDWFYWAFCVEDAAGQTLTFHLDQSWLGYYGPAVSHNLNHWHWLTEAYDTPVSDTFAYTFGVDENRVYFAHHMLYHPEHFTSFCQSNKLKQQVLCRSEKGHDVPCVRLGNGSKTILLTARHHACESTGNYVMEGVLEELCREPLSDVEIVAVPFMDYDGVIRGDQGKSRHPWDHNRDYTPQKESRYASVRAVRAIAAKQELCGGFDFHSPWHSGGINDCVFIPQKHYETQKATIRLANLFEQETTAEALPYEAKNTYPPDTDWNKRGTDCFGTYMFETAGAQLAFALETPYFDCSGTPFSPQRARETGRCFARALRAYYGRGAKISFTGNLLCPTSVNALRRETDFHEYLSMLKPLWTRLPDTDYLVGNLDMPSCNVAGAGHTGSLDSSGIPDGLQEALRLFGFDMLTVTQNQDNDRNQSVSLVIPDAGNRDGAKRTNFDITSSDSETTLIREINGIRVGLIHAVCAAQASDSIMPPERVQQAAQRMREQCDVVIMLLCGGGHLPETDTGTCEDLEELREFCPDLVVLHQSRPMLPFALVEDRFMALGLGTLMCLEPFQTNLSNSPYDGFSAVLNLTLTMEDGKIEKRLSFRLCQTWYDAESDALPKVADTYDRWSECPSDSYRDLILGCANRLMPNMHYKEPMAEYPIGLL